MKRIPKGTIGAMLISAAGTILAFLGMTRPARTASLSEEGVISSSSTMTTGGRLPFSRDYFGPI